MRLEMNRTGSMGSRVPPAVTSTLSPARSPVAPDGPVPARTAAAAATIVGGIGQAAGADVAAGQAARLSGSTTCTPLDRRTARLSCTAACSHISVCIAGATSTGARVASSVLVSRSSLMPAA